MSTLCFNCGGTLRETDGKAVCENCGSYLSRQISNEEVMLLTSACQTLRLANFADAEAAFDDIIKRHPKNAQAYWGRLLAGYGIKYEEDYDGSRVPTCYAASIESVFDSSDYKKALEYADPENREIFKEHAAYIERCRKNWIEKAQKEQPYDIFISYKDSIGIKRTQDSYTAQDLYRYLQDKGYRVFFSRESLKGISGKEYEPYIFNALDTARVMIVYGTKPEYINATWVKNEWTRYLKRMRAGEKKEGSLLVAYDGFAPKELSGVLARLQCLDAKDIFFLSNLTHAVESILSEKTSEAVSSKTSSVKESAPLCKHETAFIVPEKPATCTQPGLSEGKYCETCGMTLKAPTYIPPKGHAFGEWRIFKKATCTENGEYERVCHCGERETQAIPSRGGHIVSDVWETVKEPAPGETGLRAKKCVVCGAHVETEGIPALPKAGPSKGLAYQVRADGKTCTVTGLGKCKDQNIKIPDKIDGYRVTAIGKDAFCFCTHLTGISMPSTVTSIGLSAFTYCEKLTSIDIPNAVTAIVDNVFNGCKSLADVTIPDSVTSIGRSAFRECTSLASVTIPSAVTSIGENAFFECTSLASVTVPNAVTRIGDHAFSGVGEVLVSEDHPAYTSMDGNLYTKDQKTLIHYAANQNETAFFIPNTVTSIGKGAFHGSKSLADVIIPDSVTSIGDCAFHSCRNLTRIAIPNAVTNIGILAFYDCKNLSTVQYVGTREQWDKMQLGADWNQNTAFTDIQFESKGLSYQVNNDGKTCTVTGQGECGDKDIVIPDKIDGYRVTSIVGGIIEKYTSGFNKNITSVTIPNAVTSIGERAFLDCTSLASVTIPNSVTSIGEKAFYACTSLASVTIPNSVTSIGESAFQGCTSLASVTIPKSVTSIGNCAFWKCTSLASVTIPNSVTSIGDNAFHACTSLASVTIPNSVTSIGNAAFAFCQSLASVTIPNSVTSIGDSAFHTCTSLASVTIPNSVTSIGSYTFYNCTSLASVTIPNSVTSIGERAFEDCTSLANVTIPNSVTSISYFAFVGVGEIKVSDDHPTYTSINGNLYSKDKKTLIHYAANHKETSFVIPNSVTSIGEGAFEDCTSLASVTIPKSVTSIGNCAFWKCTSLASVTIPKSVTSIGEMAFYDCTSLKNIRYDGTKSQWKQISLGSNWRNGSDIRTIECTKGLFKTITLSI